MFNELGLYLANMEEKDCDRRELLQMMAKYGIYPTVAGQKRGFENSIYCEDGKIIALIDDDAYSHLIKNLGNVTGEKLVFLPSDKDYGDFLWHCIENVRDELREWYDSMIENNGVNFEHINKTTSALKIRIMAISPTSDPWQPQMGMEFDSSTFKAFVISREIILPLFRNEGHEFQRIRRCPECGTYFYAKDIRKVFCSNGCRSTNAYKAKTQQ